MSEPFILVDGSSYFFRAFHALPPLINSKNQATGAIYGVANMLKRLMKDYKSSHLVVVFDAKGKTFRNDLYPLYKAHRPPMPIELQTQIKPLENLLSAMGLPLLSIPGVEADDVIGTLAVAASKEGFQVIISTGDKDMAQLVNEKICLINTMTNQVYDTNGVLNKFGVLPNRIIDYLALIGDTSDNVPGVPKCGPKTAVKWLEEYQNVENIIANAHEISGKVGENLRASLANLELAKKLVTIKTDVELPCNVSDLTLKPTNKNILAQILTELEFKTWLKELDNSQEEVSINLAQETLKFELITETKQLEAWVLALNSCSLFSLDTETTSLDAIAAELVGISLAIDEDKTAYIPIAHIDKHSQLPLDIVLNALKPILENPKIKKVGQNLKYDYIVFKNYAITIQGIAFDTMLESYLLNSASNQHNLDSLALKYLNYKTTTFKDIAGTGTKQLRFDQISLEVAAPYASEDANICLKLHKTLYPQMDNTLKQVLNEIEMPLLTVIAEMERHGVLIDENLLHIHGERLKKEIELLKIKAETLAQRTFNLSSPKQLQEILYDQLKLPVLAKTPTGQPSTAESVLQELSYEFELPAVILKYRSLTKLVSTYIDALPKQINPKSKRIHTSYNQAVTSTGRLSSSNPNLQNIPIRSIEGRLIRRAFVAPPNHLLLTADYSQIELRIMAHLSQDPNLIKAFNEGRDIHAATASELFEVPIENVNDEERRRAKAVNFGLIYGMSAFGLAKQLGVARQDAQSYIDLYFKRYPQVLAYMERTRAKAHQDQFVETLFGRRLYLPEINGRNKILQKAAERTAINAPLQGTAADLIKKSMLSIASWQNQMQKPLVTMIMQVHDELVFEVQQDYIELAKDEIKNRMEHAIELSVPLLVSIGVGPNWDDAH